MFRVLNLISTIRDRQTQPSNKERKTLKPQTHTYTHNVCILHIEYAYTEIRHFSDHLDSLWLIDSFNNLFILYTLVFFSQVCLMGEIRSPETRFTDSCKLPSLQPPLIKIFK